MDLHNISDMLVGRSMEGETIAASQGTGKGEWLLTETPASGTATRGVVVGLPILFAGLLTWAIVIDLQSWGRSPEWFEIVMPLTFAVALAIAGWLVIRGPLGKPPMAIRLSEDSITFKYSDTRLLSIQTSSPRFSVQIEDVFGSWDPKDWRGTGPKSRRFVLLPPRGRGVYLDESVVRDIIDWANGMSLSMARSSEYRRYDAVCHKIVIRRGHAATEI